MFKSKEHKEEIRQQKEERARREAELGQRLAELQGELKTANSRLEKRQKEFDRAFSGYKQEVSTKWEYLEVSSKQLSQWGSIDRLGAMGWELVGIATYTEKVTQWNEVIGTIYTMYVFKRLIPPVPDTMAAEYLDLTELAGQVLLIEGQIMQVQEQQAHLE